MMPGKKQIILCMLFLLLIGNVAALDKTNLTAEEKDARRIYNNNFIEEYYKTKPYINKEDSFDGSNGYFNNLNDKDKIKIYGVLWCCFIIGIILTIIAIIYFNKRGNYFKA